MTFEGDELERLRHSTSKILLAVLWIHVPIAVIAALILGADWLVPASFTPLWRWQRRCRGERAGMGLQPAWSLPSP